MPTAKISRSKNTKKAPAPATEDHEHEERPDDHEAPTKKVRPVEIDDADGLMGGEEKPEVDPLTDAEGEDEFGSEEASLDGEELNPFGDRWEE